MSRPLREGSRIVRPIGLRMRAPTKQRRFRSVQALTHTGNRSTDEESASTKDVTSTAPGAPGTPRISIEARLLFEGQREGGACRRFVGGYVGWGVR